jgi:putative component of toxin-antitoxin plasmid stabilization module
MQTVQETPEFITWSKAVWLEEERIEFIDWISQNPNSGDVIQGTKGLRKVRFTRQGMGARSGARVIYFNRRDDGLIVLLLVYAKAKFDNIRTEILNKLKEKYDV